MENSQSDRCGYTWPEHYEIGDPVYHQSCCWRETMEDAEYCAWHADSEKVSKSVEELQKVRASPEIRTKNLIPGLGIIQHQYELIDGADMSGINLGDEISLEHTAIRQGDFSEANLSDADLSHANLSGADFEHANLSGADLERAVFLNAKFENADLSEVECEGAGFFDANLRYADFTDAHLSSSVFTRADLSFSDLTDAILGGACLTSTVLEHAVLVRTTLFSADLTDARPHGATFTDVQISDDTVLRSKKQRIKDGRRWQRGPFLPPERCGYDPAVTTLFDGSDLDELECSVCVHQCSIDMSFDNLERVECSMCGHQWSTGMSFDDSLEVECSVCGHQWSTGMSFDDSLDGTDCSVCAASGESISVINRHPNLQTDEKTLKRWLPGMAAGTYQTYERLARENARPSLQSEMFVLRQDMQRKRHWHNRKYFNWGFARLSRAVFKYGESLGRILSCAILVVLAYTAIYTQFDLITDVNGEFVVDPVDALYFSTLTFTTLGLGDFQPSPASEFARLLVTSQAALGAILIAIFVFVLGRRAAR